VDHSRPASLLAQVMGSNASHVRGRGRPRWRSGARNAAPGCNDRLPPSAGALYEFQSSEGGWCGRYRGGRAGEFWGPEWRVAH